MGHAQRIGLAVALFSLMGCHGITPNPLPTQPAPVALVAQKIIISVAPGELPAGGGVATIRLEVQAADGRIVRDVPVTITASAGTLERTAVTSDFTGHAETTWRGEATATVRATSETAAAEAPIIVRNNPGAPTPAPPTPSPSPSPSPSPTPSPTPAPRTLLVDIFPNPRGGDPVTPITFTPRVVASDSSELGSLSYAWDFETDGRIDSTEAVPTHLFAPADHWTVTLTVTAADGRSGRATVDVVIGAIPIPAISVTLAAAPTSAGVGETFAFTATTEGNSTAGAVTSFAWDFDAGTPSVDRTTATGSTTTSYLTPGTRTVRVTATSANGATATTTRTVTVTDRPLVVRLSTTPATVGAPVTITATVTSTGTIPASMTFSWDYNNDGTVDEITTGGTPATVTYAYNSTGTKTARVTITAPDGRTASNTVSILVT